MLASKWKLTLSLNVGVVRLCGTSSKDTALGPICLRRWLAAMLAVNLHLLKALTNPAGDPVTVDERSECDVSNGENAQGIARMRINFVSMVDWNADAE